MEWSLRGWRPEDAGELARLITPGVLANLRDGIPYPYTRQDGEAFLSSLLSAEPGKVFAFAVTAGGRLAGSITAYRGANVHFRTAELGYYLGEEWWGRGLGTWAVSLACRRIFETSDILRIYAMPFAGNAASCRVLEKAGFVLEGRLRSAAVKDGRVLDMKLYALVRDAGDGKGGAGA